MAKKKAQEQEYTIDEDGNVQVQYKESTFEPIPSAEYDLIIQNVEVREGQDSGQPYFAFEFRTSDPDPDLDNKVVWENISPQAAWRVTQLIESAWGPQDLEEDDILEFNIFDLFGTRVRARVGLEEIEKGPRTGEMRNCITRFLVAGEEEGPSKKPPAKAKRKSTAKAKKPAKKAARKSKK